MYKIEGKKNNLQDRRNTMQNPKNDKKRALYTISSKFIYYSMSILGL